MKAYFSIQLKRLAKMLPSIMAVALLLCIGLAVVFGSMIKLDENSEKREKFTIGVVGDATESYLGIGITALETIDSSRFAIEFIETDEEKAKTFLKNGEISAYIVIPDGFIESVMYGEILKIKYYTTPDSVGMVTIFKDEITQMISDVLIESQKGIYGMEHAMSDSGNDSQALEKMNELCVEYIELILNRTDMYDNEILGISDGLSIQGYFLCGIVTLFLFLFGISCAPMFVKKDLSLNKMISAKGVSSFRQVLSEYFSYFLLMMLIVFVALLSFSLIDSLKEIVPELEYMDISAALVLTVKLIPMMAMITAFQFVLFELTSDIVSGVLLQFLSSVSLAYVAGCFYPINFFPVIIQKISIFLPSGIARSFLAGCIREESVIILFLMTVIYFVLFMGIAVFIRNRKIAGKRGA